MKYSSLHTKASKVELLLIKLHCLQLSIFLGFNIQRNEGLTHTVSCIISYVNPHLGDYFSRAPSVCDANLNGKEIGGELTPFLQQLFAWLMKRL